MQGGPSWRASQRAGLHTVPVIVRAVSDQEMLELAIIENVQRADLNAIEEAGGYRELIERFGYTQDKLPEVIGKGRSLSDLAGHLRTNGVPCSRDEARGLVLAAVEAIHRALAGPPREARLTTDQPRRPLVVPDDRG